MQATILQTIIIMLKIICITVYEYLKLMLKSINGKPSRSYISKMILEWSRKLLKCVDAKYEIIYHSKTPYQYNKPTIVMCNHTSHYDIPISFVALPNINLRMIAKKELFKIPLLNHAMKYTEMPSIDRSNLEQAKKDFLYAKKLLNSGIVLWIAPEGTRSQSRKFLPLKKGGFITAMEISANIIPMYIHNAQKILPPKTWSFHFKQKVEIHMGTPIQSDDYSTKEELMQDFKKQWHDLQEHAMKTNQ